MKFTLILFTASFSTVIALNLSLSAAKYSGADSRQQRRFLPNVAKSAVQLSQLPKIPRSDFRYPADRTTKNHVERRRASENTKYKPTILLSIRNLSPSAQLIATGDLKIANIEGTELKNVPRTISSAKENRTGAKDDKAYAESYQILQKETFVEPIEHKINVESKTTTAEQQQTVAVSMEHMITQKTKAKSNQLYEGAIMEANIEKNLNALMLANSDSYSQAENEQYMETGTISQPKESASDQGYSTEQNPVYENSLITNHPRIAMRKINQMVNNDSKSNAQNVAANVHLDEGVNEVGVATTLYQAGFAKELEREIDPVSTENQKNGAISCETASSHSIQQNDAHRERVEENRLPQSFEQSKVPAVTENLPPATEELRYETRGSNKLETRNYPDIPEEKLATGTVAHEFEPNSPAGKGYDTIASENKIGPPGYAYPSYGKESYGEWTRTNQTQYMEDTGQSNAMFESSVVENKSPQLLTGTHEFYGESSMIADEMQTELNKQNGSIAGWVHNETLVAQKTNRPCDVADSINQRLPAAHPEVHGGETNGEKGGEKVSSDTSGNQSYRKIPLESFLENEDTVRHVTTNQLHQSIVVTTAENADNSESKLNQPKCIDIEENTTDRIDTDRDQYQTGSNIVYESSVERMKLQQEAQTKVNKDGDNLAFELSTVSESIGELFMVTTVMSPQSVDGVIQNGDQQNRIVKTDIQKLPTFSDSVATKRIDEKFIESNVQISIEESRKNSKSSDERETNESRISITRTDQDHGENVDETAKGSNTVGIPYQNSYVTDRLHENEESFNPRENTAELIKHKAIDGSQIVITKPHQSTEEALWNNVNYSGIEPIHSLPLFDRKENPAERADIIKLQYIDRETAHNIVYENGDKDIKSRQDLQEPQNEHKESTLRGKYDESGGISVVVNEQKSVGSLVQVIAHKDRIEQNQLQKSSAFAAGYESSQQSIQSLKKNNKIETRAGNSIAMEMKTKTYEDIGNENRKEQTEYLTEPKETLIIRSEGHSSGVSQHEDSDASNIDKNHLQSTAKLPTVYTAERNSRGQVTDDARTYQELNENQNRFLKSAKKVDNLQARAHKHHQQKVKPAAVEYQPDMINNSNEHLEHIENRIIAGSNSRPKSDPSISSLPPPQTNHIKEEGISFEKYFTDSASNLANAYPTELTETFNTRSEGNLSQRLAKISQSNDVYKSGIGVSLSHTTTQPNTSDLIFENKVDVTELQYPKHSSGSLDQYASNVIYENGAKEIWSVQESHIPANKRGEGNVEGKEGESRKISDKGYHQQKLVDAFVQEATYAGGIVYQNQLQKSSEFSSQEKNLQVSQNATNSQTKNPEIETRAGNSIAMEMKIKTYEDIGNANRKEQTEYLTEPKETFNIRSEGHSSGVDQHQEQFSSRSLDKYETKIETGQQHLTAHSESNIDRNRVPSNIIGQTASTSTSFELHEIPGSVNQKWIPEPGNGNANVYIPYPQQPAGLSENEGNYEGNVQETYSRQLTRSNLIINEVDLNQPKKAANVGQNTDSDANNIDKNNLRSTAKLPTVYTAETNSDGQVTDDARTYREHNAHQNSFLKGQKNADNLHTRLHQHHQLKVQPAALGYPPDVKKIYNEHLEHIENRIIAGTHSGHKSDLIVPSLPPSESKIIKEGAGCVSLVKYSTDSAPSFTNLPPGTHHPTDFAARHSTIPSSVNSNEYLRNRNGEGAQHGKYCNCHNIEQGAKPPQIHARNKSTQAKPTQIPARTKSTQAKLTQIPARTKSTQVKPTIPRISWKLVTVSKHERTSIPSNAAYYHPMPYNPGFRPQHFGQPNGFRPQTGRKANAYRFNVNNHHQINIYRPGTANPVSNFAPLTGYTSQRSVGQAGCCNGNWMSHTGQLCSPIISNPCASNCEKTGYPPVMLIPPLNPCGSSCQQPRCC